MGKEIREAVILTLVYMSAIITKALCHLSTPAQPNGSVLITLPIIYKAAAFATAIFRVSPYALSFSKLISTSSFSISTFLASIAPADSISVSCSMFFLVSFMEVENISKSS